MKKVGIVGAGNMGALHAGLAIGREGVEFLGFTDLDVSRAESRAKEFGGQAFDSVDKMIDAGADLVFVTVPNTKHLDVVLKCLKSGVRVFSEKPLVTGLADAEKVMDAVGWNEEQLYVGFNRRFAPVYAKAKEIVSDGFKVFSGNIVFNDGDMTNPTWVTNIEMTGGFLYDSTIHMFDMIRYLADEVAELRCVSQQRVYPLADNFAMEFTTVSGQTFVMSSNGHASWAWPAERMQLWGDHATVITEELDVTQHCTTDKSAIESINVKNLDRNVKWGYVQMHDDLFGSLLQGKPASVKASDGYKSVLITDALYRSAAQDGKVIKL